MEFVRQKFKSLFEMFDHQDLFLVVWHVEFEGQRKVKKGIERHSNGELDIEKKSNLPSRKPSFVQAFSHNKSASVPVHKSRVGFSRL